MPLGVCHCWDRPYGVRMYRCARNGHLMLGVGLQAVHYMSGMCSLALRAARLASGDVNRCLLIF